MHRARLRPLTFALVALLVNALLAVVVHRHFNEHGQAGPATVLISLTDPSNHNSQSSGRGNQCAICRLQRNFQADLPTPALVCDSTPRSEGYVPITDEPRLRGLFLSPLDRAPPF